MQESIVQKFSIDLDDDTKQKCINDIEQLFEEGHWQRQLPPYQTFPVLFARPEDHWQKMANLFSDVITQAANKAPQHVHAWSYISFVGKPVSLDGKWHNHFESQKEKLCAIFYLQYEDEQNGTRFLHDDHMIVPIIHPNTVYVFSASIMHSPTAWDHENRSKNRIVLATDYYF